MIHRYFTPDFTFAFAFAFVIPNVINSEIIFFRFALISVSMALSRKSRYADSNLLVVWPNIVIFGVTDMAVTPADRLAVSQDRRCTRTV